MRSPPHSWYSARVTLTLESSLDLAKAAIPRQASSRGSEAREMLMGVSGARMGRSVEVSRSERPGIRDGPPVRKMSWKVYGEDEQQRRESGD